MTNFVVFDPVGKILRSGSCPEYDVSLQATGSEQAIVGTAHDLQHYVDIATNQICDFPPKPSEYHTFNYATHLWDEPANLLDLQKKTKLADLAAFRYNHSIGGITVNGLFILTDPGSQAALTGAYTSMQAGLLTSIDWKAENGWITLDLPTVTALATAVAEFVQGCFTREKTLAAQINAAPDAATLEVIDITASWPT